MLTRSLNRICFVCSLLFFFNTARSQDIFDAARKGNCTQINNLIQINPDTIRQLNPNGFTPLILACYYRQKEAVQLLLKKGADLETDSPEGTALLAAVYKNDLEISQLLLLNGAKINTTNTEGTTALMFACMSGNLEMVKLLLQHGADKNMVSKQGHSALTLARKYAFKEIESALINH